MSGNLLTVPLWLDLSAVGVGSLQGALFASGFKRIDLLGIAIIGTLSGLGGGLLRDILLGITPAALQSNWYLLVAVLAAFLGMLLDRVFQKIDPLIIFADALTIGLFAALGTTKAFAFNLPVIPAIFIGVITAVGGGILRDLILNLPVALMHVGSLYAVASLMGSGALVLTRYFGLDMIIGGVICVSTTVIIRLLAVKYGWSLPEQRSLSRKKLAAKAKELHARTGFSFKRKKRS